MKKIIVEIDGQRHRLVEDGGAFGCDRCSLFHSCNNNAIDLCEGLDHKDCHFEKEEEG